MKTSTPSSPAVKTPPAILLIGPPGGRKTTLLMQFPGVWIGDCDLNLRGPERFIREGTKDLSGKVIYQPLNPNLSYSSDTIPLDDDGKSVDKTKCYDRLITKLDIAVKTPEIKTVVVDSMTTVNEFIIQKILGAQKREDMEKRDWTPFKSKFMDLLYSHLRNSGKTVIVTVHETILEDVTINSRTVVGYTPSVNGKIKDFFGGFFTDVWRCEVRQVPTTPTNPEGLESCMTTLPTTKSPYLKNSLGLPKEMKADYKLIETYLNK